MCGRYSVLGKRTRCIGHGRDHATVEANEPGQKNKTVLIATAHQLSRNRSPHIGIDQDERRFDRPRRTLTQHTRAFTLPHNTHEPYLATASASAARSWPRSAGSCPLKAVRPPGKQENATREKKVRKLKQTRPTDRLASVTQRERDKEAFFTHKSTQAQIKRSGLL